MLRLRSAQVLFKFMFIRVYLGGFVANLLWNARKRTMNSRQNI